MFNPMQMLGMLQHSNNPSMLMISIHAPLRGATVAGNFRHIMGREHTLLNRCHNPFFKIYAIDEFVGAVLARYTFLSVTAIVTVLFSGSMYSMAVHRATAVLAEYLAG